MSIRVLLVDDQVLTRQGIRTFLQAERDIEVIGEATGGHDALGQTIALRPDLVIMDIMMSQGDGISTISAIKQQCPGTRVLILTTYADSDLFLQAAKAGATGYILKDTSRQELVDAIREVHNGNAMLSPTIARQMMDHFFASKRTGTRQPRRSIHELTEREVDVLTGVAQGLSDKEIATRLFLSRTTVKTHLRSLYHRLKFRNRAQAAAFALERGLLTRGRPEIPR